ncbi:MAG: polysaccharide biosynthesis/export family protein, partial [Planctomycetales bacterium]|nr:polysaccharide biosynthesis/export family protein [Planctomycetales bacterium]
MDGRQRMFLLRATACLLCLITSGCIHGIQSHRAGLTANAIPAHRLPKSLQNRSKDNQVWIDFTRLSQPQPPEHVIGPGDVLGIHIPSVLETEGELPAVAYPSQSAGRNLNSPSVGHPVTVAADGTVHLPLVAPIYVAGQSVNEAAETIIRPYVEASILNDSRARATVSVIRPRTVTVFVIRQDVSATDVTLIRRDSAVLTKRGSAHALEMPVFKNDVLHLLAETGGLPGEDAQNELWILRSAAQGELQQTQLLASLEAGIAPDVAAERMGTHCTRIPMRVCPGDDWNLPPGIGILQDGDVVFVPGR